MYDFIHEYPDWPNFRWNGDFLAARLAEVRHHQGRLLGRLDALGLRTREHTLLDTLSEDVLKSSEIEGDRLDLQQVRSSVARRIGLEYAGPRFVDRDVDSVVEMMLDATTNFQAPLTRDRLFAWHAALFPAARSAMRPIRVGNFRLDSAGPMQVVSGPIGRERIHFQAPDAPRLPAEVDSFLAWFHGPNDTDWVMKAAIAHFWLVTLHPFDDGNGRIARAVADLALARSEQSSQRFYSLSGQIRLERDDYYAILERTQRGSLDITPWLDWFLGCMGRAIARAQVTLSSVLRHAHFWQSAAQFPLNERQRLVLTRLLAGFQGNLTSGKYATLTKSSHDTALRDLSALLTWGLLQRSSSGGRSTHYTLPLTPDP